MPVCITGMHRSGTSMVANLMHACGLYLGPDDELAPLTPDNARGYWENTDFKALNEEILKAAGGSWYLPPSAEADLTLPIDVRDRATRLIEKFLRHEPWGWKDPRNSLTLPFWLKLLPETKVVICLRNPLEVAQSLRARAVFKYSSGNVAWRYYKELRAKLSFERRRLFSVSSCLRLWYIYNCRVLDYIEPERRIITHYETFFADAVGELHRILSFLGMPADENLVEQAADISSRALRHKQSSVEEFSRVEVPPEILNLYLAMCEEANIRTAARDHAI